jgi:hypothetical protein
MLGIQPRPTVGELAVWLLYLVPVALVVCWPRRTRTTSPASTSTPGPPLTV